MTIPQEAREAETIEALTARIAVLEGALERVIHIIERHNGRQAEKVDDARLIARAALAAKAP